MKKFSFLIILIILNSINIPLNASQSNNTRASSSSNHVTSISSDLNYSIELNKSWSNNVTIEKEVYGYNYERILEKINFYYLPENTKNKKVPIMSVFVFFTSDWNRNKLSEKYTYLSENSKYIFAKTSVTENFFTGKQDNINFGRLISDASNSDFVRGMIKATKGKSNKVIVNNVQIKTNAIFNDKNTPYIPLREVCNSLGYKIGWDSKNRSISIISGSNDKYINLYTSGKKVKYKIEIKNGVSYIGTVFFINELKANVEIDENNNIYIST